MAAKIRFEWDEDIRGNTVLLARKKGKITIAEIQEGLTYSQNLQGNYALIVRATEFMREGSGWMDEIAPTEDVVELYPINENEDCPICRVAIPPYQYCPKCGHELKEESKRGIKMKSEWRVSSNYVDGKKYFGVYRLLDTDAVDHSGNREPAGCGLLESRNDAAFIAGQLNLHRKEENQ